MILAIKSCFFKVSTLVMRSFLAISLSSASFNADSALRSYMDHRFNEGCGTNRTQAARPLEKR
jgi:hypothetical protein